MGMKRVLELFALALSLVLLVPGCSDESREDTADSTSGISPTSGAADGSTAKADEGSEGLEPPDYGTDGTGPAGDGGGNCQPKPTDATLTGTVFAPNLEVPISGALVYVTTQDPEPIPDGVYCAECVGVPCDAQFVLTNADGSFELPAPSGPGQKLVVAKGQFLRVSDIDIEPGDNAVPPDLANLPGRWEPETGRWIPRIAVVDTATDSIYNVLGKIGMGNVSANGELERGSESFDLM